MSKPVKFTIAGVIVAVIAGLLPIDEIAALANAGTLIAFMAVGLCLIIMRRRAPDMPRPFRAPAGLLVGLGAILGCAYLFISLPAQTQYYFLIWNAIGLVIYFAYGLARSRAG